MKYKLHEISVKLRQQAAKNADVSDIDQLKYKCVSCGRKSKESDITKAMSILMNNQLIQDPVFMEADGTLKCYFCQNEVLKDSEAVQINHAIGTRESRFNNQIRALVAKIKEVDELVFTNKAFHGIPLPQVRARSYFFAGGEERRSDFS